MKNNNIYTCPMHPEIIQNKPGQCPKCGMKLEIKGAISSIVPHSDQKNEYRPLIVVIGFILITTLALVVRDFLYSSPSLYNLISYFMTGFFLVFSGFKLMDLKGFAEGYSTYDLLAKRWYGYGYIYPFIELVFGLTMLVGLHTKQLLWTELIIMSFSGLGVAIKISRKEKFQCACLGTFLKVPLTKVTLIEDFGMALLAGILLIISS